MIFFNILASELIKMHFYIMINTQFEIIMCCIIKILNFNDFDDDKSLKSFYLFFKTLLILVKSNKHNLKSHIK